MAVKFKRSHPAKYAVLVAVGLLVLTGCAGTPAPEAAPAPAPAPAAATEDVDEWASVVAEQSAYLAEWKDEWDADGCRSAPPSDFPCAAAALSGTYITQTVSLGLKAPTTTAAKGYIGEVPEKISALYGDTLALADAAVAAGANWSAECNATPGDDCLTLTFKFDNAVEALTTKFAAWAPYL